MDQLAQLAADHHRQRLAYAQAQRPAQRVLALGRATHLSRGIRQALPGAPPPH
jgi:hypothetical protein